MNDSNQNIQINDVATVINTLRFEQLEPLLLAGLREPLRENAAREIPLLWQRFNALAEKIVQRTDKDGYGVCVQTDNRAQDFYYMASCAVNDFSALPVELSPMIIPSQRYAVFAHHGPVSNIRDTISVAFDEWLPASDYQLAQQTTHSVHFFEKYTEAFDPLTGIGGMEIWVPIVACK